MTSHLEKILASVRERTEAMKAILGPNDTARLVADRPDTPRGFTAALSSSSSRTKIIAEVKRASPSKGLLREDLDAVEYARDCEDAGAVALSVLTERNFFIKLKEIVYGKKLHDPLCQRKEGKAPKETIDLADTLAIASSKVVEPSLDDIGEEFYGDAEFNEDELGDLAELEGEDL